ncbi:hypothetical protein AVEN_158850-1 [Araneus ventricosus]|uniref:RNase H type-1 domain-containing protein n=1 Tax=Araneus ventricosus TaxID=182803 RepID=A0A4Y2E8V5_ARAVE|nr:hypothetical protein AVEN_158850-1 [Araneus ventricosus]
MFFLQHRLTGWTTHTPKHLLPHQITLDYGGSNKVSIRLYTNGSKSPIGVGLAFCVMQENNPTHQLSAKLMKDNTVFQTELLALNEAVNYATTTIKTNLPVTIFVDNRAKDHQKNCQGNFRNTSRKPPHKNFMDKVPRVLFQK